MRNGNKGFTLVELIVVIAIIGVLAAVLVPNYISYVGKARTSVCSCSLEEAGHYYTVNTALADENYGAILKQSLVELGGENVDIGAVADGKQTASCTGLCPSGGEYMITISAGNGAVVKYLCTEHSAEGVEIKTMTDENDYIKLSVGVYALMSGSIAPPGDKTQTFADYFKTAGKSIDSNGPNYAPLLNAELESLKLSTGETAIWRVCAMTDTAAVDENDPSAGYKKQYKIYYVDTEKDTKNKNGSYNGKQINVDVVGNVTRYQVVNAELTVATKTQLNAATGKNETYKYINNGRIEVFNDTDEWTRLT